jgi:hypothetical protein
VLTLNTSQKRLGINAAPGTLLHVTDGIVAAPSYDGIRLGNASEALFSSTDSIRGFYAGVTGGTVVAGSTTSHDLLLQRGGVTALTLGASGVASFAGPVRATGTSAAAPAFTGSDTDTGIYFPAANQVRISTSGTVALSVDASQNVGIGTTSPGASSRLAVAGGFIATAAGYGLYQPGDHLALNAGAGKNVYLKPNDGGLLAVNVGATSCDFTGVANYGLKLQSTPGNTNPNTLDCYNENTSWSPTVTWGTGGTVTTTSSTGAYTQIGNVVTFTVTIGYNCSVVPTGGSVSIDLPRTSASGLNQRPGTWAFNSFNGSAGTNFLSIGGGVTTAQLRVATAAGTADIAVNLTVTASGALVVTVTYLAS